MKSKKFGRVLDRTGKELNLEFEADLRNKRFIEYGSGGRMVTFKLWKKTELVKIQVNFIEKILFGVKEAKVKTLLSNVKLSKEDWVYFDEFLKYYREFEVQAYDEREILCEKIRAILTRRAQKLRDFYDLFMLYKHGFRVADYKDSIIDKIRFSLYYKKYRDALEKNKRELSISRQILGDPFERSLFIIKPPLEFESFLKEIKREIEMLAIEL